VQTHADVAGVHVADADDEHGVNARTFGFANLCLDRAWAEVTLHAQLFGASQSGNFPVGVMMPPKLRREFALCI